MPPHPCQHTGTAGGAGGTAAKDAEFDYDRELQRGAALGSAGLLQHGGGGGGSGGGQGGTAGVVGGLLTKQPDWLRGSNSAAAATDASAGACA